MWKGWASTVTIAALGLSILAAGEAQAKVEGDTVYLGAAVSLTGKYTTAGEHTRRGYDLAVKTINDAGGISVSGKTYRLEIIYYDDESTPARGAQLAERLINQDGVEFMLGPYSSGLTKAIAPVTEQYGVPMVEANGASLQLFNKGYRYLFAVLSTTEQYLASAVALAAELAEREGRDPATLKLAAGFRERSLQSGHSRRRPRRCREFRHPGRGRRPAAARAQRHGGDAGQDEGAEARHPRRLRPLEGCGARHQAGRGDEGRCADAGDHALRQRRRDRQVRCRVGVHALRESVGADSLLPG